MTADGRIDVSFAGATVRFAHRGPRSAGIARFLWQGVSPVRPLAPTLTCRLEDVDSGGALRLRVGLESGDEQLSEGTAASRLVDAAVYHFADRSRGGLVVHGACVADTEGAVVLPGGTGAGKTTLTSWLVAHGWRYVTDELVFVPDRSLTVRGLARPLNVKATAVGALRQFLDLDAKAHDTFEIPSGLLLRPSALNAERPVRLARITRLLFPRYERHAPYTLTPLSAARAGARLMGCLLNARNLPGHGFREVTRLVRAIPAHELRYGGVGQLADWRR
jgi:hypothetical protein